MFMDAGFDGHMPDIRGHARTESESETETETETETKKNKSGSAKNADPTSASSDTTRQMQSKPRSGPISPSDDQTRTTDAKGPQRVQASLRSDPDKRAKRRSPPDPQLALDRERWCLTVERLLAYPRAELRGAALWATWTRARTAHGIDALVRSLEGLAHGSDDDVAFARRCGPVGLLSERMIPRGLAVEREVASASRSRAEGLPLVRAQPLPPPPTPEQIAAARACRPTWARDQPGQAAAASEESDDVPF